MRLVLWLGLGLLITLMFGIWNLIDLTNNLSKNIFSPIKLSGQTYLNTSQTQTNLNISQTQTKLNTLQIPKKKNAHVNITNFLVIFPFRNRHTHYSKIMETFTKIKKKHWNFTVFVIEQDDDDYFRRAWLINIGLQFALKMFSDDTCVVTHDVDLQPSLNIDYTWCDLPTQICSEISCFNNGVPYPHSAGGVVQAKLKHWSQINGMTNRAFGWGGEDDDLFYRLKANKFTPIRRPKLGHGRCLCLNDENHTKRLKSEKYSAIVHQIERMKRGSNEWKMDGINNLQFNVHSQYIDNWGSQWFRVGKNNHPMSSIIQPEHSTLSETMNFSFDSEQLQKNIINKNIIRVSTKDLIMQRGYDTSPIVIEKYRLVLFTIPKAACTVIKQLARRLVGKHDWKIANDKIPHDPLVNGLTYLRSYDVEKATSIMTSPNWTRAIFVRDPHVRVLSAYLDKAIRHDYVKQKCHTSPKTFSDFLALISRCKDSHWQTQKSFVDDKWWPFINFMGHVESASHDTRRLLIKLGIWEQYGKYGWGVNNGSIFQKNFIAERATGSKDRLWDYYTKYEWDKVTELYDVDMKFRNQNYSALFSKIRYSQDEKTLLGVIGILSAEQNVILRESSRSTWISYLKGSFIIKFLLDRPNNQTVMEQSKYGDIIFLNSSSSGRAKQFGEKLAIWIRYAQQNWPSAGLIAKMDDDVFLCPCILPHLRSKIHPRLYMGWKHTKASQALWNGHVNRNERMDEMFVVLGSDLANRIGSREYCHSQKACPHGLVDTDYGGTSLGLWLELYDDIEVIPMNSYVVHYQDYSNLTCNEKCLFHKASSQQMQTLNMTIFKV